MSKIKIYLASPYTIGDVAVNVANQIKAANDLMDEGYAVFVPLLSHFQHLLYPRPYKDWLAHDLEWITSCDVLLRLPGDSKGADEEVAYAYSRDIPVMFSQAELHDWMLCK